MGPDDSGSESVILAPPNIGDKQCLACPPPHVPQPLLRVSGHLTLLAKICVGADGAVDRVSILKGIAADVDDQAKTTIQKWRFSPMSVNGRPVAFCYFSRFSFSIE
jgi:TonB family protein